MACSSLHLIFQSGVANPLTSTSRTLPSRICSTKSMMYLVTSLPFRRNSSLYCLSTLAITPESRSPLIESMNAASLLES